MLLRASLALQPAMTHEQASRTAWALAELELVGPSITAYSSQVDTAARGASAQAAQQQQQVRCAQGAPFCPPVSSMHVLRPDKGAGRGSYRTMSSAEGGHLVRGEYQPAVLELCDQLVAHATPGSLRCLHLERWRVCWCAGVWCDRVTPYRMQLTWTETDSNCPSVAP